MSADDWPSSPTSGSFPNRDQQSELDGCHHEGEHLWTNDCKGSCDWNKMQSCHENVHLVVGDGGKMLAEDLETYVCVDDLDVDLEIGIGVQL